MMTTLSRILKTAAVIVFNLSLIVFALACLIALGSRIEGHRVDDYDQMHTNQMHTDERRVGHGM